MGILELFGRIPGQRRLALQLEAHVREPKNSYFLVGPEESGSSEIAIAFAQAIMCSEQGCGDCDVCTSISVGAHPDVFLYQRSGPFLTVDDAHEIVKMAYRTASASKYKIIVIPELELVGRAAPSLLKCIEEPPVSTIFVLLASMATSELETLMSRSVSMWLDPLSDETIFQQLISLGYEPDISRAATDLGAGAWVRAVKLADDKELRESFSIWREVPSLVTRDMRVIIELVDRLIAAISLMEDRKRPEFARELENIAEVATRMGVKKSPLLEAAKERHKRELRKIRTQELKSGLLLLERQYRDSLLTGDLSPERLHYCVSAVKHVEEAQRGMVFNANEFLLLVSLLSRLSG